jgi:hypothetical protein
MRAFLADSESRLCYSVIRRVIETPHKSPHSLVDARGASVEVDEGSGCVRRP